MIMAPKMTFVGMTGSLRTGSYNMALLKAAQTLVPDGVELKILPIGDLPLFNQDLEQSLPPQVQAFKDAVKAADAIVFAIPEYNYSVPGVLKNAID